MASLRAASLAASLLQEACEAADPKGPRFGTALELARGCAAEFDALAEADPAVAAVEGALLAADLANLAACAAADLVGDAGTNGSAPPSALAPASAPASALAATHLAVGAAHALHALVEGAHRAGEAPTRALADAASAGWRARFAARQAEEVRGVSSGG